MALFVSDQDENAHADNLFKSAMPILKYLRPDYRCPVPGSGSIRQLPQLIALMALVFSPLLSANDKRVTIPLTLPIQQAINAPSSATTSSAPTLNSTQFTQTLEHNPQAVVSNPPQATAQPAQPAVQPKPAPPAASRANPRADDKIPPAADIASDEAIRNSKLLAKKIPLITTASIAAPRYPQGHPEAFVTQFEDYVAREIAPYVPGVAIVIVSQGQIRSLQAYGVKRAGTREKMTPDTVFRLASVSKPVAATATAILVQEGQLSWNAKVTSVLPDVKFKSTRYGEQINLRHLLSQSVGLPSHANTSVIEAGMSYAEAVRRLRLVNFVCQPGKCYAYQNITYSLAGDMVSKQYGKPFEDFVEDKLFTPLNMRSASFGLESFLASPNRASPHIASGKRWIPTHVTPNYYRIPPAAGANASIVDMSRFLMAQLGKRPDVLSPATLKQLQARVTHNSPAQNHYGTRDAVGNTAYGLGWRVFDYGRYKNFAHHGGWVKGFRSEVVFNRDLGIGMVFLTNSETRLARNVIFKFMDLHEIAQEEAKKARRTAATP
ncbi:beta-lactamase [Cellvibrio japonicus Ueda107]|uniref:Beta-lactamase n=3 Tax=Cellvibrio japonicus TaxID=155077 RepID=B3PGW9_CELJU|nr:beta-lactamase [Cellvibrio japonicus Ueda107]